MLRQNDLDKYGKNVQGRLLVKMCGIRKLASFLQPWGYASSVKFIEKNTIGRFHQIFSLSDK